MKNPAGNKTDIVNIKDQSIIDDLLSVNKSLQKELEEYRKANAIQKKQIDRLKRLIEKIRDGYARAEDAITIVDLTDGENYLKIFDMNPMAQKIFNISHQRIDNGLDFKDIIPETNYRIFIEELLPMLKKGKTVVSRDDVDSEYGYWDSTIYPMKDKKGTISFVAAISRNVTLEHENRKLSAILQAAIDSLPVEIWIRNTDGYEIYQNKASRDVVGDMIGTTLTDLDLSADALKYHKANAKKVIEGETVIEEYIIEKDGKTKWIEILLNPIWSSNKTIGYSTIVTDITYRKAAEISLRKSEERFRLIARHSKNLLYDHYLTTGYIEWDGAIEEVTGFSPEEYRDVRFDQWSQLIHPDDKEDVLTLFEKSMVENQPFKAQYRHKKKNGEYIWIEENSNVVELSDGSPSRLFGVMKDITEQKKAEETIYKSQKLLNDSQRIAHIGSWEYYYRDDILLWNEESYKILGIEKTDHIPAIEDFIHLVHPDDRQALIDHFEKTVKENEYKDIEYRIVRPDGEIRTLLTVGAINLDEKGNAYRSFGIIQDITERKQMERELLTSVISTEERERLYFSQELHDGLGPLLSAAKLYVEWLADPTPDVDQGAVILDIWKILEESNKSIRDISFKLSPHTLQNYGLAEALKAYVNKVQQTAKAKITINNSVKERVDNTIETILYRVMCECINNTIKHANAKSISIKIEMAGNMLNATYADDGKGFNIENTVENRKGIGLLNMQSRVRAVNGTLTIDSAHGKGTKVEIKIPVGV
jgi:PAS domain S-box-containing protein